MIRGDLSALAALAAFSSIPVLLPASASAQQQVIGGGAGYTCYMHALRGRSGAPAINDCSRAMRVGAPARYDIGATLVNRAIVRIHGGDYGRALEDVEQSFVYHDFAEGVATRGVVYFHMGRIPDSIEQYTAALGRADLDEPAKVYYNRGVSYEAVDRIEEAYYDYLRAAELDPDWRLPREELTRFTVEPIAAPSS